MADLVKREAMATPVVYEARPQDIWVDDYLDQHAAKYYQVILKRKWLVLGVALVVFAGALRKRYVHRCALPPIQCAAPGAALSYRQIACALRE